ncbi:hypothetical protein [Proteus myxofaciens]|uniref:Uncharacterized protein n=1 Tax=Proteus myxofaciens ATCC 19692 TaxID=1354337 RepID=A0A198G2J5_9GAMM|nr:hypothetical protein [Proteus myxofaciens]OAT30959.1 hypothetical protein M983_1478 [Proteus myxofaciens ATCC 19692]
MSDDNFSPQKIALTTFQQSPLDVLEKNSTIEVCDDNHASLFYCLSKQDYDALIERVMDAEFAAIVLERRQKKLDTLDLD